MSYRQSHGRQKHHGLLWWLGITLIVAVLIGAVAFFIGARWYDNNLQPVAAADSSVTAITVEEGSTSQDVAQLLEGKGLIRSATAYGLYIRFNGEGMQALAGEYELSPSMSVSEIVSILAKGENTFRSVTILPAQRIDQIRDALIDAGYSEAEVLSALDPSKYANHPALVDKPRAANLEGYLYPETFNVSPSAPVGDIVSLALDETAKAFTPQIRQDLLTNHGLDLHQAVILASIIEREVSNPEDRTKVAQVFLRRYKEGISLGSDPTALYGALIAGIEPSVTADTLYNTRIYAGLPPGPINNISEESLQALAYPASTDFLFFVSGDDGKTYFSRTQAEHEALAAQHCIELCRSY